VDIQVINAPPGLRIAASAEGKPGPLGSHYELKSARSFAWSASNRYIVYEDRSGPIAVTSYTFSEHTPAGREAAHASARAAALYHDLFDPPAGGPYPRPHLSVVEADFFDGMEYEGLYFLGKEYYDEYDDSPAGYLTTLAVHETAHQWWYGMVGDDQATQPWLDEALCTYSERLYYEHDYPDLVNWWWEFRVNRFMPSGYVDGSIYDFESFRPYVNAVYLRGALFLEHLRTLIGDEAFYAFLKDYAQSQAGQIATQEDFFNQLKKHSQVDISALLREYFGRK
jgi:aminopeptidase N